MLARILTRWEMDEVHFDGGDRERYRAGEEGLGCFGWVPQLVILRSQELQFPTCCLDIEARSDEGIGGRIQRPNSSSSQLHFENTPEQIKGSKFLLE